MAAEVKVATVCFQHSPEGTSPYLNIDGRPQSKNENSDFNFRAVDCCKKAEQILRKKCWKITFLNSATDGVSSDATFVRKALSNYLLGICSYSGHNDTNHNCKSARGQLIGAGSSKATTIGLYIIDPGLLKKANIASELWRVVDFASDLLVLRLCSPKTCISILNLEGQDFRTQVVTCKTLFWTRIHLFAVNTKSLKVTAREKVFMLWSSCNSFSI